MLKFLEYTTVKKNHKMANFKCICGVVKEFRASRVFSGETKSCGCYRVKVNTTHNMSKTSEYSIWENIKSRCYNKKVRSYCDYGGRGIGVCDRWLNSFENFISDMGKKPSESHTIDRVNNDDDYGPDNCRWSTIDEQKFNKRNNIFLTVNGKTKPLKIWSDECGVNYKTALSRYHKGYSVEKILK